jgi:hypothetical protein
MSRVNIRGWTPIDDDDKRWDDENYWEVVRVTLDGLATRWSKIKHAEERRYFLRSTDYDEPEFEDEIEQRAFELARKTELELEEKEMKLIEGAMNELGARLMRPYEHWNEDEAYMEYMERDREG